MVEVKTRRRMCAVARYVDRAVHVINGYPAEVTVFDWLKKRGGNKPSATPTQIVDTVLAADAAGATDAEVVAKLTALGMSEEQAGDAIEQIREGFEDGKAFADIEAFGNAGMKVHTENPGSDDLFEIAVQRGKQVGGDLAAG